MSRLREEVLERYLDTQVRRRGGLTYKFAPLVAGNPDRIVLAPYGHIYLVEMKAPDGHLDPAQVLWHARAAEAGHQVHVLWSRDDVDRFVKWIIRESDKPKRRAPRNYISESADAFDEVLG